MNSADLHFARFHPRIAHSIKDAADVIGSGHPSHNPTWDDRLADARTALDTQARLRIALVGEWNAGKSSLIKVLTGTDVLIDADVATGEIGEYDWNGVTLVDTPGVHPDFDDTDHDRLSRQATRGADLVLFVMSNELFSPRLAEHFRFVVADEGLGLGAKTAIVVNKMDREQNPDEVIVTEIDRTVGEAADVPVWFCAASSYLDALELPDDLRGQFLRESRLPALRDRINAFILDRGALGRLLTPLQEVEDVLDQAEAALATTEEDRDRLELLRRQKRVLVQLGDDLEAVRVRWRKQARTLVIQGAEGAAAQVTLDSTDDDLQHLHNEALRAVGPDLDANLEGLTADLLHHYAQADERLAEIAESPLGSEVAGFDSTRPESVGVDGSGQSHKSGARLGKKLVERVDPRSAVDKLAGALKQASEDPRQMRDLVYKVGKNRGHNFRPWEAVRKGEAVAKWAGRAGKSLPFLMAGIDLIRQVRAENELERREKRLAEARAALRRSFSEQAEAEAQAIDVAVQQFAEGPVAEAIGTIDQTSSEVVQRSSEQRHRAFRIAEIKRGLRNLRDAIQRQVLDEETA